MATPSVRDVVLGLRSDTVKPRYPKGYARELCHLTDTLDIAVGFWVEPPDLYPTACPRGQTRCVSSGWARA